MIRTFKYRLFTNKSQRDALDYILWQQRILYNAALEQRKTVYKATGQGISYADQWAHFRDERRANPDTFGLVNATSLQQLLRRVDKAYHAFFRRHRHHAVHVLLAPTVAVPVHARLVRHIDAHGQGVALQLEDQR